MSNRQDEPFPSSSSTSRNDNRVEPRFFGDPSIYQNAAPQKNKDTSQPPAENLYWTNPPPPYSPPPNEPESSNSSDATGPSAPPLEIPFTSQTQAPTSLHSPSLGNYPPLNYERQQQPQNYPPQGYNHYGAVNHQAQYPYVNPNSTVSDANPSIASNNWPWIASPSGATGPQQQQQPLMGYSLPSSPSQQPPANPAKKQKSCFEMLLKYVFYFFCICLVIRMIGLLSGGVSYADSCSHGFIWEALPNYFEFNDTGLRIRTVGGSLSSGHITIRKAKDNNQNALVSGYVEATALISPAILADNPELNYSLTRLDNGSITLDIYIPHDLSPRACVSLNAVIYLPDALEFIQLDVQNTRIDTKIEDDMNVEALLFSTTNAQIELASKWVGQLLQLQTTNANIRIEQPIDKAEVVSITTTNADIQFRRPVTDIAEFIVAQTSNGGINADALLSSEAVQLTTTNGYVSVDSLRAARAELKSTNHRIAVNHANVSQRMNVQTTNGDLSVHLDEGRYTEMITRTTNGEINLSLPANYEARFEIETSRASKFAYSDPFNWSHMTYTRGYITGIRFDPAIGKRPEIGHLQAKSSNANIYVRYADV